VEEGARGFHRGPVSPPKFFFRRVGASGVDPPQPFFHLWCRFRNRRARSVSSRTSCTGSGLGRWRGGVLGKRGRWGEWRNHGGVERGDLEVRGEAKQGNGDVGGEGSTHGRTKKRSLVQGRWRTRNYHGGVGEGEKMKEMRVGTGGGSDKGERGQGGKEKGRAKEDSR
jgi:hypothetical protein